MLTVYTRHAETCPKKDDFRWRRCRCPKWINGKLDSVFIRRSAQTRSWEKADELRRRWEEAETPEKTEPVSIEAAVEAYITDAKARELREATITKLESIFRKQFLGCFWQLHLAHFGGLFWPTL